MNEIEIKSALHSGVVKIIFTKKDGTERTLYATTKMDVIPSEKHPVGTNRVLSDEVCRCFDIEKDEWRSFIWDSVILTEVVSEYVLEYPDTTN